MSQAIINVMAVFAVLGALDRILGNRFGLGEQFEAGAKTAGSLILAMVGIISLSPLLANILEPVVVPVFSLLGADPAVFAGTILANDMGGAALARDLALFVKKGYAPQRGMAVDMFPRTPHVETVVYLSGKQVDDSAHVL